MGTHKRERQGDDRIRNNNPVVNNLPRDANGKPLGRPKGLRNKVTTQLKEMVLEALDNAGGVEYLTRQANDNPRAFLALLGKVLPLRITGPSGDGGFDLRVIVNGENVTTREEKVIEHQTEH